MNWCRNVLEIWHLGTLPMKYGVDDLFALKIALNDPRSQNFFFFEKFGPGVIKCTKNGPDKKKFGKCSIFLAITSQ